MFVIPLAGLSSRFFKAGYTVPKYQLSIDDETVFSWAVTSFRKYFETDFFLFICRRDYDTENFIHSEVERLGIKSYSVIVLERETLGQADTVYQGLEQIGKVDSELYIFNIDSKRHDFVKPSWSTTVDGYLEVFKGIGDHWSFIEPARNMKQVLRTTEKLRISDYCSDGLYYFKSSNEYCKLVQNAIANKNFTKGELYIAPLYNNLINSGQRIVFDLILSDQISFCGTPDEYKLLLNK